MKEPETPASSNQWAFARLLPKLFRGGQAFLGAEAIISGLCPTLALQKPTGLPHSVAELVAHVNWWNRWMLDIIEVGSLYPQSAKGTWPLPEDWQAIKSEFYELLVRIDAHAARSDLASPINHDETLGELLADFALHTAYHFGQIVTVRQAIGAWPPPGGGDTW
jgi:hypothetical protein